MKLAVYSLKKTLFEGQARALNCKTAAGEITILDNHEPLIGMLVSGTAKVTDETGKEHFFEVKNGFFEVKPGSQVRCLVN